jgi:hypothetical protein
MPENTQDKKAPVIRRKRPSRENRHGEPPKSTQIVVVATALGFDGLRRRKRGEKFRMTLDKKGEFELPSWVVTPEEWAEIRKAEKKQEQEKELSAETSTESGSDSVI